MCKLKMLFKRNDCVLCYLPKTHCVSLRSNKDTESITFLMKHLQGGFLEYFDTCIVYYQSFSSLPLPVALMQLLVPYSH